MRNSTRRVIQGSSTALLRILSPHHVNRPRVFSPTSFILPRRSFASRRAAALADGHDQDQDQDQHNEEFTAARRWLSKLDAQTVPRHLCDISFSRSGGPGGQNVNKCVHILQSVIEANWLWYSGRIVRRLLTRLHKIGSTPKQLSKSRSRLSSLSCPELSTPNCNPRVTLPSAQIFL